MRTIVCFIVLFTASIYTTSTATAQELDRKSRVLQKRLDLYENNLLQTKWQPGRGVTLLTVEKGEQVWKDYAENSKKNIPNTNSCYVPSLEVDEKKAAITSHFVFSTDEMYMFAYTTDWQRGDNLIWKICTKNDKLIVHSSAYEAGYEFDDPSVANGDGCGASSTVIKFEELHRDSPLFLSVTLRRCMDEENHHELLFHLDEKTLKEVEGSRMDMDYEEHPSQPWRWWHPEEGFTPRTYELSERGNATWTRKARKRLSGLHSEHEQVSVSRTCEYEKKSRRVTCTEKILKKARLDYYSIAMTYLYHCKTEKSKCEDVLKSDFDNLINNGFLIEKEELNRVLNNYKYILIDIVKD